MAGKKQQAQVLVLVTCSNQNKNKSASQFAGLFYAMAENKKPCGAGLW